jgi:hypothetical protein
MSGRRTGARALEPSSSRADPCALLALARAWFAQHASDVRKPRAKRRAAKVRTGIVVTTEFVQQTMCKLGVRCRVPNQFIDLSGGCKDVARFPISALRIDDRPPFVIARLFHPILVEVRGEELFERIKRHDVG